MEDSLSYLDNPLLSANHNPEKWCVICTGVTLFALVLHLNCTALSQSESVIFLVHIIKNRKEYIKYNSIVICIRISIVDNVNEFWARIGTVNK